jgi:hypothetical protein
MTFLSPWALWALAALPVVIALYFLRLKRRALRVSTHMFWERAANKTSRNAFFQRLRHLFSLLLHLLIVLLLVGALARPVVDRFIHDGASVVIVLDCRARMQATSPDGKARFEKALQAARGYVREASDQRQFAIIKMDAAAAVAVPFTGDEKPLLDTLENAQASDAAGDIDSALTLASSLLDARKGARRIILLSDRPPAAEPRFPLTAHAFPATTENVAITRFATRQLPANPETSEVLLEVRNFGKSPIRTNVELSYDGKPLDVKSVDLASGATSISVFPALVKSARTARGWLTAKLDSADGLALDNVAFAALPPARAKRVLLISKGSFFLERLLDADTSIKFELLTPDAYSPELGAKFAAVIFDGELPAGFDIAKAAGNFLFVKATPFPAGAVVEQPLVTEVDTGHPTTRNVSLQNVSILKTQSLAIPAPADGWTYSAPLRSFENALLVVGQRRSQRLAALAFDVVDSDLPLRVAFPLLISNTVHWLAGDEPDALPSLAAGKTFALTADQRASSQPLAEWPLDGVVEKPSIGGAFRPMKNGFYQVDESSGARWLAVNTYSAAESSLNSADETNSQVSLPTTLLSGWPIWQWLAIAAFALLIGEWWLHHRRRTE